MVGFTSGVAGKFLVGSLGGSAFAQPCPGSARLTMTGILIGFASGATEKLPEISCLDGGFTSGVAGKFLVGSLGGSAFAQPCPGSARLTMTGILIGFASGATEKLLEISCVWMWLGFISGASGKFLKISCVWMVGFASGVAGKLPETFFKTKSSCSWCLIVKYGLLSVVKNCTYGAVLWFCGTKIVMEVIGAKTNYLWG